MRGVKQMCVTMAEENGYVPIFDPATEGTIRLSEVRVGSAHGASGNSGRTDSLHDGHRPGTFVFQSRNRVISRKRG